MAAPVANALDGLLFFFRTGTHGGRLRPRACRAFTSEAVSTPEEPSALRIGSIRVLAAPVLVRSSWGVRVQSMETGKILFAGNSRQAADSRFESETADRRSGRYRRPGAGLPVHDPDLDRWSRSRTGRWRATSSSQGARRPDLGRTLQQPRSREDGAGGSFRRVPAVASEFTGSGNPSNPGPAARRTPACWKRKARSGGGRGTTWSTVTGAVPQRSCSSTRESLWSASPRPIRDLRRTCCGARKRP